MSDEKENKPMAEETKTTQHQEENKQNHAEKRPVLIALDGSSHADYAYEWYMEHLHKPNHYVIILHVPDRHAFLVGPLGGTADVETIRMLMEEEEAKEKGLLEKLGQRLRDSGIGGKVKSVAGKPGEVIVHVADEEKAEFIVCGSRGKGTLRRTLLGSISDYVLHHAHIPVVVCRHKDTHREVGLGTPKSSPSLKHRILNSPLLRRKNKDSPKNSPNTARKDLLVQEKTRTTSESSQD